MATIAFLGLGIMGAPMAVNLVRAGFDVMGWNRTSSKATPVREAGGSVAKTPAEAVEGAEFILSILDSGPVVREVFFDSGAVDHMLSGAIFIDMASIPPKMAQAHATLLKEVGVGHLDVRHSGVMSAPVPKRTGVFNSSRCRRKALWSCRVSPLS